MIELKRCPFCGEEAKMTIGKYRKINMRIIIQCRECFAENGCREFHFGMDLSKSIISASETWNKRV